MSNNFRAATGERVRAFYEEYSFPGYEDFETPADLVEKARTGVYARLLDEQVPLGARILDAGCGTGQLAIFLSLFHRHVVGADFSYNSLCHGNRFKNRFRLRNVAFVQMDIFHLGLKQESFDYIFCNGVLHHTADAYGAFQNLCGLLKRGGYLTLGLYNTYGRLLVDLRKNMFRLTHDRLKSLDFRMRQRAIGDGKKRIWFMDQYKNPHEQKFTVDEVLNWFRRNDFEYVNSIPKIRVGEQFTDTDRLFDRHDPGGPLDHLLCQLSWIFTQGREGGFFITIGRRI